MENVKRYFDRYSAISTSKSRLPHWQQDGCTYFVTFRLADSIPQRLLAEWKQERDGWLRWNPPPWTPAQEREYHLQFSGKIDRWMDDSLGSCVLSQGNNASIVADAMQAFDGVHCLQHAWIIMPNHVHALFSLVRGMTLEQMVGSWKGVSARHINQALGRSGPLW